DITSTLPAVAQMQQESPTHYTPQREQDHRWHSEPRNRFHGPGGIGRETREMQKLECDLMKDESSDEAGNESEENALDHVAYLTRRSHAASNKNDSPDDIDGFTL